MGAVFGTLSFSRYMKVTDSAALTMVSFPGEILMGMLKMLILLSSQSYPQAARSVSRMGSRPLGVLHVTTVLIAAILGVILVLGIHRGTPNWGGHRARHAASSLLLLRAGPAARC
ncbi:excitatory amino acid transporter 2-like protein [Lates japonicus]|uniref:Excitatory amino acid transporter 2-like protein n=1 Tax=Lates japonicus TaxID=270547 RepID=A0AAD3NKG6_LATJO|nr:excitatory amino acid transporter 2-like protein [Lates japonicus]